jgi:hypothetical protein
VQHYLLDMVTTPPQIQLSKEDAYAENLSNRTRTSCLGALAIIWAILGEKKIDAGLNVSKSSKIALLAVALGAIVVLAFDFFESAFGYIRSRQTAGHTKVTPVSYKRWEDVMRFGKLIVGPITLIALCLVLACILSASLNAQTQRPANETHFIGTWCGVAVESAGKTITGSYRCADVHVSLPDDKMILTIGYPDILDKTKWVTCANYIFADPNIYANCAGDGDVQLEPTSSDEVINYIHGAPPGQKQFLRNTK